MAKRSAGSYALLQSILLGVGFALLVLISVATVFLVDRAGADAKRLTNTLTLHGSLSNLLLEVRRAESSQRGYLFTNDESYLTDFYETEPAIRQVFEQLRRLSTANPHRLASLDRAAKLVDTKVAEMAETIRLNQESHREDAGAN